MLGHAVAKRDCPPGACGAGRSWRWAPNLGEDRHVVEHMGAGREGHWSPAGGGAAWSRRSCERHVAEDVADVVGENCFLPSGCIIWARRGAGWHTHGRQHQLSQENG